MNLIERLRNPMWCHGPGESDLKLDTDTARRDMVEAADEIERMRAALEYYAAYERFGFRCETARAALNPSPAGEE